MTTTTTNDANGHGFKQRPGGRRTPITYQGRTQGLTEWAREYGISRQTLSSRLFRDGMPIERALNTPMKAHSTREQVSERRDNVLAIINSMEHPVTVRQVYYRAVVKEIVRKTESAYKTIGNVITELRESEAIPWDWIVDNTRRVLEYQMFDSASAALFHCARTFTRDPWCDADVSVAIWMEKDALAGVLETITLPLGVPLFVLKGFGSLSFIKEAAERFNKAERLVYCYHLGDFDPSGRGARVALETRLNEFCTVPMHFRSLALDQTQIDAWKLPSRETKVSDTRLERFVREFGTDKRIKTLDRDIAGMTKDDKLDYLLELSPESVELDAIEPDRLRGLVRRAIMRHTSNARIKENERRERAITERLYEIARENAD